MTKAERGTRDLMNIFLLIQNEKKKNFEYLLRWLKPANFLKVKKLLLKSSVLLLLTGDLAGLSLPSLWRLAFDNSIRPGPVLFLGKLLKALFALELALSTLAFFHSVVVKVTLALPFSIFHGGNLSAVAHAWGWNVSSSNSLEYLTGSFLADIKRSPGIAVIGLAPLIVEENVDQLSWKSAEEKSQKLHFDFPLQDNVG